MTGQILHQNLTQAAHVQLTGDLVQDLLQTENELSIDYVILNYDQIKLKHSSIEVVGLVGFDAENQSFVLLKMDIQKEIEVSRSILSKRENEVLQLVTLGHTNMQIAKRLMIAESTVKTHLQSIFAKLKVQSRTQAAMFAIQAGWVSD